LLNEKRVIRSPVLKDFLISNNCDFPITTKYVLVFVVLLTVIACGVPQFVVPVDKETFGKS